MSFLATEVSVDRLSGLGPSQGLASGGRHKGFCPGVKPLSYTNIYCYHAIALETAVRLEFHHRGKFEMDTNPRHLS